MERLDPSQFDDWDRFIERSENGALFHTAWWHAAWGEAPAVHVEWSPDGEIVAGAAFYSTHLHGVRAIAPPPLSPRNGPVFCSPAGTRADRHRFFKWLQLSYVAACPEVELCEVRLGSEMPDTMAFSWAGFKVEPRPTYVIPPCTGDWRGSMSGHHGRHLAKARRESSRLGGRLESGAPLGEVLPLLRMTAEVQGFTLTEPLEPWWEQVVRRDAGTAYLLRDGAGRGLCATVTVWDRRKSYYLLGGIHPEVRGTSLNFLLLERMIDDAHAAGRIFDFEGSGLQGIERFFRGWGGEIDPGYRAIRVTRRDLAERLFREQLDELERRSRLDIREIAAASGFTL